jgi:tetratricopeptide (TPR) repeat protein
MEKSAFLLAIRGRGSIGRLRPFSHSPVGRQETRMNSSKIVAALLLAGAMTAATPAMAQQPAPAPTDPTKLVTHIPKVTPAAVKAIQTLQNAVNANNTAEIPAALAAAQAAAKTPDDKYFVGLLQLKAAAATKDQSAIAASLETLAASGGAAQNEQFSLYYNLGQSYTALKQYDKAAADYQKALDASPNNVDAIAGLAEARAAEGQPAAAIQLIQQGIKAQQTGGQKAPESWYKRAVSLAYGAQLPQAVDLSREWVQAYPSADSWKNAIAIYRNLDHPDSEATLDLLRLEAAQGALSSPGEYALYASSVASQGNYTEAQAILDKGLAAKAISPSDADIGGLLSDIRKEPKATDAGLAEASTIAKDSLPLVHIGDRYAAMGEYSKATDAYRAAQSKPGADPNLIKLHLGMALARQGDKAAAAAAFKSVSGPLSGVAQYWLLYVAPSA